MRKLQVHPSSYEATLEHERSGGTGDRDRNGFGAVFGMPGNQHRVLGHRYRRVIAVLRLNLQHGSRWKVCEEYSPFNLRLNDLAVHCIAEIGMRCEQW
jgi:hypothetical protein